MQSFMSTRRGTLIVGAVAAILAGAVLLVYTSQYRDSLSASTNPVTKRIIQAALVLEAPSSTPSGLGTSNSSNVVLRLTDQQAADVAFAVDNGKVWVTLLPQTGATASATGIVTIETELLGIKPVT